MSNFSATPAERAAAAEAVNPQQEPVREFGSSRQLDETFHPHPHPHGNAADEMNSFIRRTSEDRHNRRARNSDSNPTDNPNNGGNNQPAKNQDPAPPATSKTGLPPKESPPLIPITFYCWKDGQLGYIDVYCKFGFTQLS